MNTKNKTMLGVAALVLALVVLPGQAAATLPVRCQPPPPNPGTFVDCQAGATAKAAIDTAYWALGVAKDACHTIWSGC